MACTECVFGFFSDPLKVGISIVSLLFSVWFFLEMREETSPRKKVGLIYAHLFSLFFPIAYYIFTNSCVSAFGSAYCGNFKPLLMIVFGSLLFSILFGYLLTPLLLRMSASSTPISNHPLDDFISLSSQRLGVKSSTLHLLDSAKPIAFCVSLFKPRIYISTGLSELLTKKEMEAVLLHEMGHIKNHSSSLKFSTYLHRLASPFSSDFSSDLTLSEKEADDFAVFAQGTSRHLLSAKRKVESFNSLE